MNIKLKDVSDTITLNLRDYYGCDDIVDETISGVFYMAVLDLKDPVNDQMQIMAAIENQRIYEHD